MGNVRFIGCLHLGHENMAKMRGFNSSFEHDEYLIQQWNSVVHKRDVVYILGDVSMETSEHYYLLDQLKGHKKVVLGNHDMGKDVPELLKYVENVSGMVHYKEFWLTHAPLHPQDLAFVKGNIHAYIHEMEVPYTEVPVDYWNKKEIIKSKSNQGYYNVDAKLIDFKPQTIEEILKRND